MRKRFVTAVVALAISVTATGCGGSHNSAADHSAVAAARAFLTSYVDGDGRVVRRDQGNDTVSEGQGYALLLADATGDASTFARVWQWTRTNLQQPNHLFAFHWTGGSVADTMPAADADTQIAWALAIASRKFHNSGYASAARAVASAIASNEIGYDDSGKPTLSAGPWAKPSGQPVTVEPGYWTFPADTTLAALTGDHRWQALAAADLAHLSALSNNGAKLPPDWAQLGGGSSGQPLSAPGAGPTSTPSTGLDGLRALVWADCTTATRNLDSHWWPLVRSTATAAPMSRSPSGQPVNNNQAPLSAVASAATAAATGDTTMRDKLLNTAADVQRHYPTYYGSAWVALGRVLLTTNRLANCGS